MRRNGKEKDGEVSVRMEWGLAKVKEKKKEKKIKMIYIERACVFLEYKIMELSSSVVLGTKACCPYQIYFEFSR